MLKTSGFFSAGLLECGVMEAECGVTGGPAVVIGSNPPEPMIFLTHSSSLSATFDRYPASNFLAADSSDYAYTTLNSDPKVSHSILAFACQLPTYAPSLLRTWLKSISGCAFWNLASVSAFLRSSLVGLPIAFCWLSN